MAHAWKACWGQPLAGSNPASSATLTSTNAGHDPRASTPEFGLSLSFSLNWAPAAPSSASGSLRVACVAGASSPHRARAGSVGYAAVRGSEGRRNSSGAPSSIHTPTRRPPTIQAASTTREPSEIVPPLETVRSTSTMPTGGGRFDACGGGPAATAPAQRACPNQRRSTSGLRFHVHRDTWSAYGAMSMLGYRHCTSASVWSSQ
jgi:hypothetical protein